MEPDLNLIRHFPDNYIMSGEDTLFASIAYSDIHGDSDHRVARYDGRGDTLQYNTGSGRRCAGRRPWGIDGRRR
jgi:hypothetical protein